MCGARVLWEISVSSAQFRSETKIALQIKSIFLKSDELEQTIAPYNMELTNVMLRENKTGPKNILFMVHLFEVQKRTQLIYGVRAKGRGKGKRTEILVFHHLSTGW